jgi:hypothetical protein
MNEKHGDWVNDGHCYRSIGRQIRERESPLFTDVGSKSNGNVNDRRNNFEISFHRSELMTLGLFMRFAEYITSVVELALMITLMRKIVSQIRLSPTRREEN